MHAPAPKLDPGISWHFPAEVFYRVRVYGDYRFKNATAKPEPLQKDKTGKPRGYIPPANKRARVRGRGRAAAKQPVVVSPPDAVTWTPFDPWAKTWNRPPFDNCTFVPAVCEGALCGGDVSARVAAKTGTTKTYSELLAAAETTPDEFRAEMANASFYFRWTFARASCGDIRWHGKISCEPDITYEQAAERRLEDALCNGLDSIRPSANVPGYRIHPQKIKSATILFTAAWG
jgi:hypothetical protein